MKWINVEDELPNINKNSVETTVLGWNREKVQCVIFRYHGKFAAPNIKIPRFFSGSCNGYVAEDITHWMQLPRPPKKENKDG